MAKQGLWAKEGQFVPVGKCKQEESGLQKSPGPEHCGAFLKAAKPSQCLFCNVISVQGYERLHIPSGLSKCSACLRFWKRCWPGVDKGRPYGKAGLPLFLCRCSAFLRLPWLQVMNLAEGCGLKCCVGMAGQKWGRLRANSDGLSTTA